MNVAIDLRCTLRIFVSTKMSGLADHVMVHTKFYDDYYNIGTNLNTEGNFVHSSTWYLIVKLTILASYLIVIIS